ncbi:hypothetical protein DPMN_056136 [Dreissena polymorpha]|uniref:Coronin n=1 Tax=Dreissena polymorpha TaxID=45954 RepID=A0A9D4CR63_DREPO|nr:hypothetical protein DPMN_056136 [Dreissena polymorpha]
MSWKFKVSKYKNAAPRFPKKEESIADLPNGLLMQTCGNHITASSKFIAFDNGGGTLGVLPLGFTGRVKTSLPILKAHADYVTDLKFSPFASDVISTCAADATVKVWKLPDAERLSEDLNTAVPVCCLPAWDRRVETLEWNPVAEHVISVACGPNIKVYDITNEAAEISDIPGHGDQVLSVCWRSNGITMVTSCKDKLVRVLDPRSCSAVQEVVGHENNKDCRVQWMGDTDLVLTTGFSKNREREIKLWDTRNFSSALKTDIVDSNNGVLMPLYDEDTNMLLAIGKADTSWSYYEVSTADPYLTRNAVERTERSEQIRGACLVPKLAMNVMEGEVDRLMLLMQNSIVPLPYIVPRKDYRQFHADLFPDTKCEEPALSAQQWAAGENGKVSLTSLDPSKRSLKPQSQKPKDKEISQTKRQQKMNSQSLLML